MDGIPDDAFQFYADLSDDNSREFWNANRDRYERSVRQPLLDLLEELTGEFGPGRLFRPNRDIRFSPDKRPYKEHQGAYVEVGKSMGYYAHVDADGFLMGAGWYNGTPAQIAKYRGAIGDPIQAASLRAALATATAAGLEIAGDKVATRPRGFAAGDPNLDLLRHRTLSVGWRRPREEVPATGRSAVDSVREVWRAARPLAAWLRLSVEGGPAQPEAAPPS